MSTTQKCIVCNKRTDQHYAMCFPCQCSTGAFQAPHPQPTDGPEVVKTKVLEMINHMRRSTGVNHNLVFTHNDPTYAADAPPFIAEDWDHMLMSIYDYIQAAQ